MEKESDYQKFLELHVRSLSVELDDDGKFFGSLIDKEGNNFTYWSDIETIRKMLCNQSVLFNTKALINFYVYLPFFAPWQD